MPRYTTSPVLEGAGVRHGFSTRQGGVSVGRFASLNLGASWGDEPEAVKENLARLAGDGGFDPAELCQVRQVHGRQVLLLREREHRAREADGMATAEPLTLGVLSADCVSLLLADGRGRAAAAHAGWRGSAAGMARAAAEALFLLGAQPKEMRVAMGPSIGPCCFEVGDEVADAFRPLCPEAVRPGPRGKPHVDLYLANRAVLLGCGLWPEHIEERPPCTMCDGEHYYSYRRDGAGIGQHLAFICGGKR